MDLGLKGKIAMVGGASKGLGYAGARALAGEGAQVSIASRDAGAIQRAAETIGRDTGAKAVAVAADLSQADGIAQWHAKTLEQFGGVDILFANTGGPPAGTALSFDDRAWQAAFGPLLLSVGRSLRLRVPAMRTHGRFSLVGRGVVHHRRRGAGRRWTHQRTSLIVTLRIEDCGLRIYRLIVRCSIVGETALAKSPIVNKSAIRNPQSSI